VCKEEDEHSKQMNLEATLSLLRDEVTRGSVSELDLSYQNLCDADVQRVCCELTRGASVSVRVVRLAGNCLQGAAVTLWRI
jgi:hypothetical protein